MTFPLTSAWIGDGSEESGQGVHLVRPKPELRDPRMIRGVEYRPTEV